MPVNRAKVWMSADSHQKHEIGTADKRTEWLAIVETKVDPGWILLVFDLELVLARLAIATREDE